MRPPPTSGRAPTRSRRPPTCGSRAARSTLSTRAWSEGVGVSRKLLHSEGGSSGRVPVISRARWTRPAQGTIGCPPVRTRSATAVTVMPPSASAASPAARINALRRVIGASARGGGGEVLHPAPCLRRVHARRIVLHELLVGRSRRRRPLRVLESPRQAVQRVVPRQGRRGIAHQAAVSLHRAVGLAASAVETRQREARQLRLEAVSAGLQLLERLLRLRVLSELDPREGGEILGPRAP